MKILKQLQEYVKAAHLAGHRVEKLYLGKRGAELLRKELPEGAALAVDGVPVEEVSARGEMINMAMLYAYTRWHVLLKRPDAESLFKAVPDDEMRDLIPLIMDQHFDGSRYKDPVAGMDADEVAQLEHYLKELGFVISPL